MNESVAILGAVCLGLSGWVIYLQKRVRLLEILLDHAFQMTRGIADGSVVVDKTSEGAIRIRTKKEIVLEEKTDE